MKISGLSKAGSVAMFGIFAMEKVGNNGTAIIANRIFRQKGKSDLWVILFVFKYLEIAWTL